MELESEFFCVNGVGVGVEVVFLALLKSELELESFFSDLLESELFFRYAGVAGGVEVVIVFATPTSLLAKLSLHVRCSYSNVPNQ